MAVGIENYPNIDTTDLANYPAGNLKDDPTGVNGTPVNVETNADIHQTFYKVLAAAGATATGNPDNVTNGYQYFDALLKLVYGNVATPFVSNDWDWIDGGAPVVTVNSGTITVTNPGDVLINRYKIIGKTLFWNFSFVNVSITGTPTEIDLALPAAIAGIQWKAPNARYVGFYNSYTLLQVIPTVALGVTYVSLKLNGANFTSGVNDQRIDAQIVIELL